MLPRCRTAGEPFVIPTFDVQVSDVEGFMDELQEFQSIFHDCFARSEARGHFLDYMVGQYSPLARKSTFPRINPTATFDGAHPVVLCKRKKAQLPISMDGIVTRSEV